MFPSRRCFWDLSLHANRAIGASWQTCQIVCIHSTTFCSKTRNGGTIMKFIHYDFLKKCWCQLCHQIGRGCGQQEAIHTFHECRHVCPNATQQERHTAVNNKRYFFNCTIFPRVESALFLDQAGQKKSHPNPNLHKLHIYKPCSWNQP